MSEYYVQVDIDQMNGDRRWMESDTSFQSRSDAVEFAENFASWLPAKQAKIIDDDGEVVWDSERESRLF